MEDLAGLSFNSGTSNSNSKPRLPLGQKPPTAPYSNANASFAHLATTASSTTAPRRGLSPSNLNGSSSKSTTQDSFANLLNFGRNAANNTATLSLQEQQRRLQEQKAKEAEERRKQMEAQFGNAQFWDALGGGGGGGGGGRSGNSGSSGTGSGGALANLGFSVPKPQVAVNKQQDDDDDLFAAFKSEAPVDKASHFPPPASETTSAIVTPRFGTPNPLQQLPKKVNAAINHDDPFDLMNLPSRGGTTSAPPPASTVTDDDDFLGLLGKPVSELPPKSIEQSKPAREPTPRSTGGDPRDAAIAELMDMGFSLAQSRKALAETDTGLDVQGAVGWLLNEAHRQSKATPSSSTSTPLSQRDGSRGPREHDRQRQTTREDDRRNPSASRRRDGSEHRQPAWAPEGGGKDKDIAAIASEVGSNLFKSANSLWTVGKKKMEKALQELQQDPKEGGDDMPKWMRDAQIHQRETERGPSHDIRGTRREPGAARAIDHEGDTKRAPKQPRRTEETLTDEALMLEAASGPPPRQSASRTTDRHLQQPHADPPSRGQSVSPLPLGRSSPADSHRQRQLDFAEQIRRKEIELREREARIAMERKAKLGKGTADEEPGAYISPARRRGKAAGTASPAPPPAPTVPEGDLLSGLRARPPEAPRNPFQQQQQQQRSTPSTVLPVKKLSTPIPVRKASSKRPAVPISQTDLAKSTHARLKGSEAFKLGDYGSALTHYSSALTPLPPTHTLRILLLCNRSICNLKVGDAKACLVDCEDALQLIGEGRGDGETVSLGDGEEKDMSGFWEKAVARKAEGLEALEKWVEAGKAWAMLVEAGKGGPNALKGRARCEKAVAPKPAPKPAAAPRAAPPAAARRPPPASQRPTQQSQQAVNKLREANNAADAVEREKLALYDSVTDRINTWKKGKDGNLRALLTSMDQILWEGSGWQKITMGQLVIPTKVKIQYMKGIAKVHPDKVGLCVVIFCGSGVEGICGWGLTLLCDRFQQMLRRSRG